MRYRIAFSPEAEEQLIELYRSIAIEASPEIAARYTDAIATYCESLQTFPMRGTKRDDVRPGLRITHYRKRTIIAFTVEADLVSILGILYAGQEYAPRLELDDE
jgi:toxin ParE1/3/4